MQAKPRCATFAEVTSFIFLLCIMKTRLIKYIEHFTIKKDNFQIKYSDIFHIPAQNIDCGYLLEPPRRGGSNECPQSMFFCFFCFFFVLFFFFCKIRKILSTLVNPVLPYKSGV